MAGLQCTKRNNPASDVVYHYHTNGPSFLVCTLTRCGTAGRRKKWLKPPRCINSVSNVTIRHHSNCSIYYHIQCGPVIYVHLLLLLLITDHSDDIANALNGTSHAVQQCPSCIERNNNMAIKAGVPITTLKDSHIILQLQFIGDLSGNVLKADGGASNAPKSNAVERKPWQAADLHFPL